VIEHDDVDLTGAEGAFSRADELELQFEPLRGIKARHVPDRDVDIGKPVRLTARLRADQHCGNYTLKIERMCQPLPRRRVDRRHPRFLVDDRHRHIVPDRPDRVQPATSTGR
jgi:hypothetical protein